MVLWPRYTTLTANAAKRNVNSTAAVKANKTIILKVIAKQKLKYDADRRHCCKKGKLKTLVHFDVNAPPSTDSLKALLKLIKGKTSG